MIKRGIISKLTIGFIFIVLLSTLLIGVIAIDMFKNNLFQIKENNITSHANKIESILKPYGKNGINSKEVREILKIVTAFENTRVWIVDINEEITTISENKDIIIEQSGEIKDTYSRVIKEALQGKRNTLQAYNSYYNENMITAGVPITDNNDRVIGAILVHSSIYDLSNVMDEFFIYLLIGLLGAVILAGLLSYYFSKIITKPIKKINESAIEMTRGNYKIKTNIHQKDEIGELSSSIDLLSSKLEYNIDQLHIEKNKLIDVITSMNDGLIALDKDLKIININNSALEILEVKEKQFSEDILEDMGLKEQVKNSLEINGKKNLQINYKRKKLRLGIASVLNNNNQITGVVIIIQDVSEQEKLEQMRKDFVANVSHEFRTPLTIIRGNLEALYDKVIPEEEIQDNYLRLLKEIKRLEVMVKDLLDLSRLQAGKVSLNIEKLDIKALLEDIIRVLRPVIKEKGILLELLVPDNLLPVWSDYDKLKQLLIIFIDNAIKFSNENGRIEIIINQNENISISIVDHGIGIPREAMPFLGERFYKVDKARKYAEKGTGLGLSIAKYLTEILNCSLKIESEINVGTKVEVTFWNISGRED